MIKITSFGSGSSGNAYIIDDGHSQLFLEMGVDLKKIKQAMQYDLSRVAGCLISHEHRDHSKYIGRLLAQTAVDVYATGGTIETVKVDDLININILDYYRLNQLRYKQTTKIGTWYVTPFDVHHDAKEPAGFLIDNTSGDRLVFVTDTYYVKYRFPNVTHIMVEANYSKDIIESKPDQDEFKKNLKSRIVASHFEINNTLDFVKSNMNDKLQEVWLIHLSDSNSNAKVFKEMAQKLTGVPVLIA